MQPGKERNNSNQGAAGMLASRGVRLSADF